MRGRVYPRVRRNKPVDPLAERSRSWQDADHGSSAGSWQDMNEDSLQRANALLAAIASRVEPGELLDETPAELGREIGFPDALVTARAVRALVARKRLVRSHGIYRLLGPSPLSPDEPGAFPYGRKPSPDPSRRTGRRREADLYEVIGRDAVGMLMELEEEAQRLRAAFEAAIEEARVARERMLRCGER